MRFDAIRFDSSSIRTKAPRGHEEAECCRESQEAAEVAKQESKERPRDELRLDGKIPIMVTRDLRFRCADSPGE